MKFQETLSFPMSAAEVAAMYATASYAQIRGESLEAKEAKAEVSGNAEESFETTSTFTMPADLAPRRVRSFIGETVTIVEKQSWSAPEADGSRTGTMTITVQRAPANAQAELKLIAEGENKSRIEIDGDMSVKIPMLGREIEKKATPYISQVLRTEETSAEKFRAAN